MYSYIHKNKKFVVAVIGVASIAFLLWLFLTGDVARIGRTGGSCVAEVDGSCITLRDYRRELLRYGNFLQNKDMEKVIKDQVLESLIVQEILYKKARELGFIPSDQEIIEIIKSDPSFQENGLFSTSKYKESLSRLGLEPAEYEEYIRKLLSIQKLLTLVGNGMYITSKEERINLLPHSVSISGKLYIISPENLQVEIKQEEILDFYTKNKEMFKREPTKVIRVWREKEKQKASEIYQALKEGKEVGNFQEVVLPQGKEAIPKELRAEVDKLNQNNRITITKAGDEYLVIYLAKEEHGQYKSLEEVKEEIKNILKEEKLSEQIKPIAEKVKEDLKQNKPAFYKYIQFSQTPAFQLLSILKLEEDELFDILLSDEKVFGPYPLLKGYGILVIEGKEEKSMDDQQRKSLVGDIYSLKRDTAINYYIQNLREKAKVKINKELIGG